MDGVEGIRYRRPQWILTRFWKDDDGRTDDAKHIGYFWSQAEATAEASHLNETNDDPAAWYEVIEVEASGVYPADENPPWVPDLERLTRRGYERRD